MDENLYNLLLNLNKPAIFAGAGISIDTPSNLLSGYSMMKNIIENSISMANIMETLKYLDPPHPASSNPGGFLRFELLLHRLKNYDKSLTVLDCIRNCKSPNLNHYILANLIISGHIVITTNFDCLIEKAYENINHLPNDSLEVIAYSEEFSKRPDEDSNNRLWKIHGSFNRQNIDISDSIQAEFTKVLTNNYSSKKQFLEQVIASNDIIVVGYSGSDDLDIIPILSETESNKRIIWIQHGSTFEDKTEIIYKQSKDIKSRFHALGLYQIIRNKGAEMVRIIQAPTSKLLSKLVNENIEEYLNKINIEKIYSIEETYFRTWASTISLTNYQKHKLTMDINEYNSAYKNSVDEKSLALEDMTTDQFRVNEIIEAYNNMNFWDGEILQGWYKELFDIEAQNPPLSIIQLYNIRACIEFELGLYSESKRNFQLIYNYYKDVGEEEQEFVVLNSMNVRDMLSIEEKQEFERALNKVGFYPVIWKQKFEYYSDKLASINSYPFLTKEVGAFLDHNKAISDLLFMKSYSIKIGDATGERNIDKLLWKLGYAEEGVATDFFFE